MIVSVRTGQGGFTLRIFNDSSVLLDNKSLKLDQIVVVRVLRPGKHVISDQVGGGSCSLTVGYPMREHALAKDKLDLYVRLNGDSTEMDPKAITSSVAQAIAIHVQDKTRIVTTMAATFDRVGTKVVTNPYKRRSPSVAENEKASSSHARDMDAPRDLTNGVIVVFSGGPFDEMNRPKCVFEWTPLFRRLIMIPLCLPRQGTKG